MPNEPLTILLVEDQYELYQRLHDFFLQKGFSILKHPKKIFIDNYEDAVSVCSTPPHLAILDIEIQGKKNGFDIAEYIKKKYYCPIIFFTGNTNDLNRSRARKLLAGGFVKKSVKPYDEEQLYEDILRLKPYALQANRHRTEEAWLNVQEIREGRPLREYVSRKISWAEVKKINTSKIDNYIELSLKNKKVFLCHTSLREIAKLAPAHFLKINSSCLLNTAYIQPGGRTEWQFFFEGNLTEVSPTYRDEFARVLLQETISST